MKENGIETTIKQLELILKARREHKEIIECVGGSCMNCDPDIKALVKSIDILSDYKRVLQENEYMHNELDKQQTKINKYAKENEELKADKEKTKAGITGVEIAARIIKECKPYCQGVHIMALGWESKVPELLKQAEI